MATTTRKSPTAAEALGEKIHFIFGGIEYLVAPTSEWSYDALEAFEDGKVTTFLREVLGADEHAKYKATKPRVSDVGDFVTALQKALGISGN